MESTFVFLLLELGRPKHNANANKMEVVRDMSVNAGPAAKTVREMALLIGVQRAKGNVAVRIKRPRRIEVRSFLAVDLGVAVQKPGI